MNKKPAVFPILKLAFLVLSALACNLPNATPSPDHEESVRETVQSLGVISTKTAQPTPSHQPLQTIEMSVDDGLEKGGLEVHETATPEASPTPTIVHLTQPSNPGSVQSWISDRSSRSLASERRAISDNFTWNLFERPYTSEVMDYMEHLDIVRAELSVNSPWVYVTIFIEGAPPEGSEASYAVEVDLDIDGRGDWLITGIVPSSTDWTTEGVQVWYDTDNDVGGLTPLFADGPHPSRNGYDNLIFDEGIGSDPDAAWTRRVSSHPDRIQLAFKHALIGSDGEFMWGAWADEGVKEPGWLDYNDHLTQGEAGSPAIESSLYPIKALAEVDNTCRWAYGFTPTGDEPGVCYIPPAPTPTATVIPGTLIGSVFRDVNMNGIWDGVDGEDAGLSGAKIRIGAGGCPSRGYASTTSSSAGSFGFTDLPPGRYCVSVVTSTLPSRPYGWHATTPTQYTVEIESDGTTGVIFGFLEIVG
jgi:hypothetical protein